jgi:methyltransferase-like protein
MVPGNYPPEIENVLQMLSQDTIHLEQYMDFLRNRMFRQTLLCHKNVTPNYALRWEQIRQFHIGSPATATEEPIDICSTEPSSFKSPDGYVLNTRVPLVKAAMAVLAEVWPCSMRFGDLVERAGERLRDAGRGETGAADDEQLLAQTLLSFYASASSSLIELSLCPPSVTCTPGERPKASPLSRLQAARQNRVTSLRHESVWLGDFERALLRRLDGSQDRNSLITALASDVAAGELQVHKDDEPIQDQDALRAALQEAIDHRLAVFARNALLMQ